MTWRWLGAAVLVAAASAMEGRAPAAPPATGPATAPAPRLLILTGQNNHGWIQSTPVLQKIYEQAGFAVTVTQTPWDLKPADLANYDVLVSNWNTFGAKEKKPTWDDGMKQAFIRFIEGGGGFVVVHAGGSFFYDWPEFQKLIGATWGAGTFHPAVQPYTVEAADKEHPITRDMKPFEIKDEPWQSMKVNNPQMRILATATIPRDKKGTGKPEPMAMAIEYGKGRCFNLVLGHTFANDANPGFVWLLTRGTRWAATGDVK
jgi:type 1 glutamine amidotransferase